MVTRSLIHVSVFPGWIAGVTYHRGEGYRCWVINPDLFHRSWVLRLVGATPLAS